MRELPEQAGRATRAMRELPDRLTYVPLPMQVLHEAVASIEDALELKVLLTVLRSLARKRPMTKWVTSDEIAQDPALAEALSSLETETRRAALGASLRRSCERGLLLCARAEDEREPAPRYTINTPANRRSVESLGLRIDGGEQPWPETVEVPHKSAIFKLYEQNVGLVTPLLVEELREAEETYPAEWIEDAFREAVGYNKRNWRYIQRILENWANDGRGERGTSWRRAEAARNRRRNVGGRFRPIVDRR